MEVAERSTKAVLEDHLEAGRFIEVDGLNTFVVDKGQGEAVFCIHGVPTSSFLYRKVIDQLAGKGMRGISIDLPGLGYTDRPADFEYTFSRFADFCASATEELGLQRFHLVVHDIVGRLALPWLPGIRKGSARSPF